MDELPLRYIDVLASRRSSQEMGVAQDPKGLEVF